MAAKLPVGFIVGPTACGKTALSVALAQRMDAEIVSADSIQVYRGMDVGSAKPDLEERGGVAHHLLDAVDIDAPHFSVMAYRTLAAEAIADIAKRNRFPLVVGGTGLYIHALTYPLRFTDTPADEDLRKRLAAQEAETPGCLYARLQQTDPQSAARLHPHDLKRIVRALEVYERTGRTLTAHGADFTNEGGEDIPYEPRMIGLTMPRELLYERINARVDAMMAAGFLDEVRAILQKGYAPELPALQGLGYKQLAAYLRGESALSLKEVVEQIKQETRRFAKRQMTWFRREKRIHWLDTTLLSGAALAEAALRILETGEGET